ncbi:MAG: Do family serine endopeptidase, partial [Treponema sp.]|nr:Do family serine endopeptidase [Treponema sp.]
NQAQIPVDSLEITKSLQATFRSISSSVLPAVVEVEVVEEVEVPDYSDFFKNFGDLFSSPFFNDGSKGRNEKKKQEQKGLGSGVIVRRNGSKVYVLTNNHVAGNAKKINVKLNDSREYEASLVGADSRMDIALVSFELKKGEDVTVAKLGDSSLVEQGDIVLALGSPMGYFASVTQGIVSATGRSGTQIDNISDFIQTDASINQGNSGGPLVNIYGEVIGINTWIASMTGGSMGLGFSIPINNIKNAIDKFIEKGKIIYGWLGVTLTELTDEQKESLGVGKADGAFASELFLNSPAIKGGFKAGDFIVELNGHAIKNTEQLVREVAGIEAGTKSVFKVLRGKTKVTLNVTIEERSDEVSGDLSKLWPGVRVTPITEEISKNLNLEKNTEGLAVIAVDPKSPAAALRLTPKTIITAVNDRKVKTLRDFYDALDTENAKELWFDIYEEGHTVSTNRYKIGK